MGAPLSSSLTPPLVSSSWTLGHKFDQSNWSKDRQGGGHQRLSRQPGEETSPNPNPNLKQCGSVAADTPSHVILCHPMPSHAIPYPHYRNWSKGRQKGRINASPDSLESSPNRNAMPCHPMPYPQKLEQGPNWSKDHQGGRINASPDSLETSPNPNQNGSAAGADTPSRRHRREGGGGRHADSAGEGEAAEEQEAALAVGTEVGNLLGRRRNWRGKLRVKKWHL
ncbi:hypothetical protein CLOM_g5145 [Closterium sp. NIES-68]|nr:hypothetical protein CLOM_g5145 [Closterium sp. NIES-68]